MDNNQKDELPFAGVLIFDNTLKMNVEPLILDTKCGHYTFSRHKFSVLDQIATWTNRHLPTHIAYLFS